VNFYTLVRRIESYILTTVHDFRAFESVKGGAFMNLKVAAEKFAQAFIKGPVNRLGKCVILGDAAALILKICVKKLQKFIRGRAQRQKCSATLAPIEVLALLISLKSANSLLWVIYFTQNTFLCVFASIPAFLKTLGSICSSK